MKHSTFRKKTKNPIIKIETRLFDYVVEAVTIAIILGSWIYAIIIYAQLPSHIPIQFNGVGEPIGFGFKMMLFLLPSISVVVYALLTLLGKKPHLFNYHVKITETNARNQYFLGVQMLRIMKLCIVIIFSGLCVYTSQVSLGHVKENATLSMLFAPLVMIMLLGPLFYFIIKMYRYR